MRHDGFREEREIVIGTERLLRVRALSDQGLEEIREELQLLAALELDGIVAVPAVLSVEHDGYDRESATPFGVSGTVGAGGRRRALGTAPSAHEREALADARFQVEELLDALHERGWVLGAPHGSGLGLRHDGTVVVLDLSGLTPSTSSAEAHADHRWTDSVLHDPDRTLRRPAIPPTGSLPAVSSTGSLPTVRRTGSLPAVRETGSQPAVSRTGSVPVVPQSTRRPVAAPTAQSHPPLPSAAAPAAAPSATPPTLPSAAPAPVTTPQNPVIPVSEPRATAAPATASEPPTASGLPALIDDHLGQAADDPGSRLDPWLSPADSIDPIPPAAPPAASPAPTAAPVTPAPSAPPVRTVPAAPSAAPRTPPPSTGTPLSTSRTGSRPSTSSSSSSSSTRPGTTSSSTSSPSARVPTFRSIAGEGEEMMKRAAALDRLGAREGLVRNKQRRRARFFGLWAAAVLFTGGAFGAGSWYATSSTRAVAEGPIPVRTATSTPAATDADGTPAAEAEDDSADGTGAIEDPTALAIDLVEARYAYITGASDEPVSKAGTAARDADDDARDAYAGVEVSGGVPVVHEAAVLEGPSDGTLVLHVVMSTPAHDLTREDGTVEHVEDAGAVGVDLRLVEDGDAWIITQTEPSAADA
ncbi:hypothetical protein ACXET9_05255 [Brachybacterium sp. DNPG3]